MGKSIKGQKCACCQGWHQVNLRELEDYRRGMRRCALIWLLASVLALVGTPDASARHKHVSPHSKKTVQVEHHKHHMTNRTLRARRH